jgi:hypothetical protein
MRTRKPGCPRCEMMELPFDYFASLSTPALHVACYWQETRCRGAGAQESPDVEARERDDVRQDAAHGFRQRRCGKVAAMSNAINATRAQDRANIAAAIISRDGGVTREFENCFEMGDGDKVAAILFRRILKNGTSRLAKNLPRFLHPGTSTRLCVQAGTLTQEEASHALYAVNLAHRTAWTVMACRCTTCREICPHESSTRVESSYWGPRVLCDECKAEIRDSAAAGAR